MLSLSATAATLEVVLILFGVVLLWRNVLSPAARARPAVDLLPKWEIIPINFLFYMWGIFAGGFLVQFLVFLLVKSFTSVPDDVRLIIASAGTDVGMLAACLLARPRLGERPVPAAAPVRAAIPWSAGAGTFLAAWPVVVAVMFVWQNGLSALGFPVEKQDAIDIFANAKDPAWLAFLVAFAVVLAPITEEIVHRGGVFRFARGRLPRWLALLGPACLFAGLHLNLASFAPLAVLGVIFSLAYERTGDLRVPMIAHSLFNLNTAVLILAGIGI